MQTKEQNKVDKIKEKIKPKTNQKPSTTSKIINTKQKTPTSLILNEQKKKIIKKKKKITTEEEKSSFKVNIENVNSKKIDKLLENARRKAENQKAKETRVEEIEDTEEILDEILKSIEVKEKSSTKKTEKEENKKTEKKKEIKQTKVAEKKEKKSDEKIDVQEMIKRAETYFVDD